MMNLFFIVLDVEGWALVRVIVVMLVMIMMNLFFIVLEIAIPLF